MMDTHIRKAQLADVPAIVEMSEQRRLQYQEYQPVFWRKAEDSREKHTPFLKSIIEKGRAIVLVYERENSLEGFVIANLVPAPPVYNPGGPTTSIDDYCVADSNDWESIGKALLEAAISEGKEQGAAQTVVVCGHLDAKKRTMLASVGFTIASEWYVKPV